ncbi:MAG: sensor histidine kinase [Spirochaetales bacterium]|nr:sensor histidine kinase [Spirochaetales bacterium]
MKLEKAQMTLLLLGSGIFLHLYAFIDYWFWINESILPRIWYKQSFLLLGLSFTVSVLMIYLKKVRYFLLIVKSIILIILGYPLGNYLNIETLLLISIIIEIVFYLPLYYELGFSIFLIFLIFLNQKAGISWGVSFGKADSHQLLFFLFITFFILSLAFILKSVIRVSEKQILNIYRLDNAIKELTETNLGFQNYVTSVEHDSIEMERKRISREMHDIIGYTLTNQLMIIQAALSMKSHIPPEIEKLLLQSQEQTREGMTQARSALYQLREFTPQSESGIKIIFKLVKTFEQVTGIKTKVDVNNVPVSFGEKIDKVIYRLIQEGLTNAFRHGHATKISVMINLEEKAIFASIWDNGIGSGKFNEGIGLSGMRERVESVNGSFTANSMQYGFSIKVRIPYNNENSFS